MHVMHEITQLFFKIIHYITITCNAEFMHYTLHSVTWENVIHYHALQVQICITPCLLVPDPCVLYCQKQTVFM